MFSKLAHFGELSFHLTHSGYKNSEVGVLVENLYDSILLIVKELVRLARLFDTVEKDKSKLQDLRNKISMLNPSCIQEYTHQN